MFDLNDAVAEWRRKLQQDGTIETEDLDELESHLRDEVERLARSGTPEEEALQIAARRLGDAHELTREFTKVGCRKFRLIELVKREMQAMNTKNGSRINLMTTLLLFIGFSGLFGLLGATALVVASVKLLGLSLQGVMQHFLSLGWLFLIYAVVGLGLGMNRLRRVERKRRCVLRSLIPALLLCPAFAIPVSYMVIAGIVIPVCMYVAVRLAIGRGELHFRWI